MRTGAGRGRLLVWVAVLCALDVLCGRAAAESPAIGHSTAKLFTVQRTRYRPQPVALILAKLVNVTTEHTMADEYVVMVSCLKQTETLQGLKDLYHLETELQLRNTRYVPDKHEFYLESLIAVGVSEQGIAKTDSLFRKIQVAVGDDGRSTVLTRPGPPLPLVSNVTVAVEHVPMCDLEIKRKNKVELVDAHNLAERFMVHDDDFIESVTEDAMEDRFNAEWRAYSDPELALRQQQQQQQLEQQQQQQQDEHALATNISDVQPPTPRHLHAPPVVPMAATSVHKPSAMAAMYLAGPSHKEDLRTSAEVRVHKDIASALKLAAESEHTMAAMRPYLVHEIATSTKFLFIIFCIIAIFLIIIPLMVCPAIVDVILGLISPMLQFIVVPALVQIVNQVLNPTVTQVIARIMLFIMNIILIMKLSMTLTMSLADSIGHELVLAVTHSAIKNTIAFVNLMVNDRVSNELVHEVTWTTSANVVHRLQHSLVHGLTHSITHTVTHKVIHHWYCIYCYYYGNYCDYCYYYEDYTYLHSLWGFGHPLQQTEPVAKGDMAVVKHQFETSPLLNALTGLGSAIKETVQGAAAQAKEEADKMVKKK